MLLKLNLFLILSILVYSCQMIEKNEVNRVNEVDLLTKDSHSFAQPQKARIVHLDWQAEVSFVNKVIKAKAIYKIQGSKRAKEIILDTKNLLIDSVFLNDTIAIENFKLGEKDEILGQALRIPIDNQTQSVSIIYSTRPEAEALQWLSPEQTAGKEFPFLFTQSQAILCRSWIPIQDSPGIRFTYTADVKVPEGFMALMSAKNPQEIDSTGNYSFQMENPIPAYLMALAVGQLDFAELGDRTGVYAEPLTLEKASAELEDVEEMLSTAETLYGPYHWGRFDILMLPPSFPFGGMENPMLTFATPTILAGDKSLTSLIAHELAHSWSGNLVTNATWEDFWLNEGFTVYFENRIVESLYGKEYADMLALISYKDLQQEMAEMIQNDQSADTQLKLNLENRNPDDGMTSIAYDKGFFFLKTLEKLAGRSNFDVFLRNYFQEHAFQSMNTKSFILYANQYLIAKYKISDSDDLLNEWIYKSGLPEGFEPPSSTKFEEVDTFLDTWLENPKDSLNQLNCCTHEWLHFLQQLPDSIGKEEMQMIDLQKSFTDSGNAEILTEWFKLSIKNNYYVAYPNMETFLIETGRRKFLMPLYSELIKTEQGKSLASRIYRKARPNYHFVSYNSLDKLLNYSNN